MIAIEHQNYFSPALLLNSLYQRTPLDPICNRRSLQVTIYGKRCAISQWDNLLLSHLEVTSWLLVAGITRTNPPLMSIDMTHTLTLGLWLVG